MIVLAASSILLVAQAQQAPAVAGPARSAEAVAADTGVLRHSSGRTPPVAFAHRVETRAIHVDGRLDDPAWANARPIGELTQRAPFDGKPATERADVRVVYDDDAIYVGARMYDSEPSRIRTELARRDANTQSDRLEVGFDSYHDHVTSYVFGVTVSGVKKDYLLGNDGGSQDEQWDPVWSVQTSRDSLGWSAEMRIPFSQLRYSTSRVQVWGMNFRRLIHRKAEDDFFAWWPVSDRGAASVFGHLFGLESLPQPRRLELLPYVTARNERIDPGVPNNPFNDGSRSFGSAGLDLKYGLSSSFTLDGTVNPDFAQVESDPAFVNLSVFEQYFEERRPFFIEGIDIFRFGGQGLFYSRRIGRPPQAQAQSRGGFVDTPPQTRILGAGKISGRTQRGWNIGLLNATTAREYARVDSAGIRFRDNVEPLTNYFVARGRRDSKNGSNQVGFMLTAVNRDIQDPALEFLRRSAYAGGIDFGHRFDRNIYNFRGSIGVSRIDGDTLAIQLAQRSSARYFQRPDAKRVRYDPSLTSLSGWTADLSLGKEAGTYQFGVSTNATSPGYEINDAGFQTGADFAGFGGFVNWRRNRPGKVIRSAFAGNNSFLGSNFDGVRTSLVYNLNLYAQLLNYWSGNLNLGRGFRALSPNLTRGGPLATLPTFWNLNLGVTSDTRRRLYGSLRFFNQWNELGGGGSTVGTSLTVRPVPAISASIGGNYQNTVTAQQYVTSKSDTSFVATFGREYVFSDVRRHTFDFTTRFNVTFSPNLSLQLYAQPFVATGEYSRLKQLARARSLDYIVYGETSGSTLDCFDATDRKIPCGSAKAAYYVADPDGSGPHASILISNRNFNVRSLRGNSVLRWEYRPGSTLFLVWTQKCSAFSDDATFAFGDDIRSLCRGPSDNVFAVKSNYWLSF